MERAAIGARENRGERKMNQGERGRAAPLLPLLRLRQPRISSSSVTTASPSSVGHHRLFELERLPKSLQKMMLLLSICGSMSMRGKVSSIGGDNITPTKIIVGKILRIGCVVMLIAVFITVLVMAVRICLNHRKRMIRVHPEPEDAGGEGLPGNDAPAA